MLLDTIGQGKFQLDFPYDDSLYEGEFKDRQSAAAKLFYTAAGISREDKEMRQKFFNDNLTFYGAPQVAFLFMPSWCGVREAADVGMFAQNLILSMRARGVGSCPQTLLGFNADAVREQLGISDDLKLLFGISFGYFDDDEPLNLVRTERDSVDGVLTII